MTNKIDLTNYYTAMEASNILGLHKKYFLKKFANQVVIGPDKKGYIPKTVIEYERTKKSNKVRDYYSTPEVAKILGITGSVLVKHHAEELKARKIDGRWNWPKEHIDLYKQQLVERDERIKDGYYTSEEAANILGVHRNVVYKYFPDDIVIGQRCMGYIPKILVDKELKFIKNHYSTSEVCEMMGMSRTNLMHRFGKLLKPVKHRGNRYWPKKAVDSFEPNYDGVAIQLENECYTLEQITSILKISKPTIVKKFADEITVYKTRKYVPRTIIDGIFQEISDCYSIKETAEKMGISENGLAKKYQGNIIYILNKIYFKKEFVDEQCRELDVESLSEYYTTEEATKVIGISRNTLIKSTERLGGKMIFNKTYWPKSNIDAEKERLQLMHDPKKLKVLNEIKRLQLEREKLYAEIAKLKDQIYN